MMPRCVFFFFCILSALCLCDAVPAFAAMDGSILPAPDAAGKWGYVDAATGKTLIAPQFSKADFFYDGAAIVEAAYPDEAYTVKTTEGRDMRIVPERAGIIDRSGRKLIPLQYVVERANSDMFLPWQGVYIPRLFWVKGGEGESIVLHADRGVIVPAGKHEDVRFSPEGGVFCDGAYYTPEGVKLSPPSGCLVAYAERETGMYRVREKKDRLGALEGVIRPDGSVLVPVKYHEISAVPGAGVWLASRGDASVKAKAIAALLTGGDPDISEDRDILTVDVYGASGKVLRSFRARYNPFVTGETYTYKSRGREYRVNAATGESAPEQEEPADAAGYRVFKENGLFGIKGASGSVTVPPAYEELHSLGGGLFAGTKRKRYYENNHGVIDGAGKEILPFVYGGIAAASYPTYATGGLRCMKFSDGSTFDGSRYWLLDRSGRFLTPEAAPYASTFYFNAAGQAKVYRAGDKEGVIDHTGREVLPCEFEDVYDELGLRESKKRNAAPGEASESADKPRPQDALYRVKRGGLWGLYDGTGRELVPCRYGYLAEPEKEWVRVEAVGDRHKNGLVNFRTGQVIPPEYASVRVYPGFFLAYRYGDTMPDGREAYILLDRKGRETARYRRAEWFEEPGVLAVRQGEQYALLDGTGKALTPFRYEDIAKAEGAFLWGRRGGQRVLLDGKGKEYRIAGQP